jgi:diguanylate cyclase (GGDEF)-like protein/PAS domain S-box-containing protein
MLKISNYAMNYKIISLFSAFLVCVVLAVIMNIRYGIDIVYTHLFYIPIILTGIWYPRYAIFLAAVLGLIHIACDYASSGTFKIGSFLRAVTFMIVAYVTSFLELKRDRLFSELQMLNHAMLDMISKIDSNGVVQYVSPSVVTVLGYTPEHMEGKPFFDFIHPDESSTVRQNFQNAMKNSSSFRMDYRYRCADGKYIWIESLANPIAGSNKGMNIYVFGSRDISIRKQAEENLKHLSIHDSLTGLHNRFLFEEELRRFGTGRFDPVSIVMCDLDGLKLVNDNLGHDVGDRLLVTAAKLLKEQFRTSDIVARIGGDEFAVLLAECPPGTVKDICDRLKQAMTSRSMPDTNIPLMMSIGYATRDGKENSIEGLIKEADENMYKEKIQNRQAFRDQFDKVISRK